jgi:hypothetical protein
MVAGQRYDREFFANFTFHGGGEDTGYWTKRQKMDEGLEKNEHIYKNWLTDALYCGMLRLKFAGMFYDRRRIY